MGPEYFAPLWKVTEMIMNLVMWIICTVAGIGMLGATFAAIYYVIRGLVDEIKRGNRETNQKIRRPE